MYAKFHNNQKLKKCMEIFPKLIKKWPKSGGKLFFLWGFFAPSHESPAGIMPLINVSKHLYGNIASISIRFFQIERKYWRPSEKMLPFETHRSILPDSNAIIDYFRSSKEIEMEGWSLLVNNLLTPLPPSIFVHHGKFGEMDSKFYL